MNASRQAIRVVQATLIFLSIATAQADIGIVTIDGEPVLKELFEGRAQQSKQKLCPPLSDGLVREEVITAWLLIREGKYQKIVIKGVDAIGVERTTERYERLASDVPGERRVLFRWEQEQALAKGYRNALIGDIDDSTRLERYRQAVKQGHPKLVNVLLLRRTVYTLEDSAERELIRQAIEAGATIPELERDGRLGNFDPYQREEFAPATLPFGYLHPDQVTGLKAGDIVYSEVWDSAIVFLHETKILSRVRPFHPIAGDDWYARRISYHLERTERVQRLETSLREAALVVEDGAEVKPALNYPECPE